MKLLRADKVADIPIEQSTKFHLVFNLKTANAMGVEVPPSLLLRADKVIECGVSSAPGPYRRNPAPLQGRL